jgi:hypothetical protein
LGNCWLFKHSSIFRMLPRAIFLRRWDDLPHRCRTWPRIKSFPTAWGLTLLPLVMVYRTDQICDHHHAHPIPRCTLGQRERLIFPCGPRLSAIWDDLNPLGTNVIPSLGA